ncbi:MAG TPA: serine/threonine-protein kinase [Kofleriaceae bacterium]
MKRDGESDPLAQTEASAPPVHAASPTEATLVPAALAETAMPASGGSGRSSIDLSDQLRIGRFIAIEKLGEGGMGLVVAAFDPQLDRKVAIKMLHDDISETHAARLEREAKAMAQLSHPNVLGVYETGLFRNRLYIAMEYVDGQTFGQWLRQRPRTQDEIFDVMMQAGRGLAAAHAVGLVHRDFKPDNILVGKDGRARVSDFGLVTGSGSDVKATVDGKRPDPRAPTSLTQTGAVMGTPMYMAPEQHDGRPADANADQFSFCVTLWQALCEELPYGADTYDDLVRNVTGGKLRPMPRGVRVPTKVRAILSRGLASDPGARFGSMMTLLAALERARRPLRWPYLAGGGVLLAAGGVVVALTVSGDRDPCAGSGERLAKIWDPARKAELQAMFGPEVWPQIASNLDRYTSTWVDRHRETCRATHVRGEQSAELLDLRMRCLDGKLADVSALLARFAETGRELRFKAIDATAGLPGFADCDDTQRLRAGIQLPAEPSARARIAELEQEVAKAVSYDKIGKYAKAREILTPLVPEARLVGYPPLEAKAVLLRASTEVRAGDFDAAMQSYREAAEAAARARDDARIAQSWTDLMTALGTRGKFAEALALEPIARTATERVSDQPKLGARFANALAGIYLAQGRRSEAKAEYEKALAFVRKDGPNSELLGHALANMGTGLWHVGDMAGGSRYLEEARARFEATLGPNHPMLGYIQRNLGDLAATRQQNKEALAYFERAQRIFENAHGKDHIDVAIALEPAIQVYVWERQYAKAREVGERVLALRTAKLGADNPQLLLTLMYLADADTAERTPEGLTRALAYLERALAITEKTYGADHVQMCEVIDRLANVYSQQRNYELAEQYRHKSLALRTKLLGVHHGDTAYSHLALGETQLGTKRFKLALDNFDRAESIWRAADPKDPDIAKAQYGRAQALLGMGKRAEAVAAARGARDSIASNEDMKHVVATIDAWLKTHSP